jgi:hypothetical protein
MKAAAENEYLLLSRGQWDPNKSKEEIQTAIDSFYAWHERLVEEGKFTQGSRLAMETVRVNEAGITDGPFAETKEVIGGYWFIIAASLQEAAAIASASPTLACGLWFEIRQLDPVRGSADLVTSETPRGT